MRSRTLLMSIALTVLTLISGNTLLHSQLPGNGRKIFGYQDAQTGAFHPVPFDSGPVSNASTALNGTLKVTLNITVKSTWPAGTARTIVCSANFFETSLTQTGGSSTYDEEASRYATATATAGVYTCTMTIPYSWLIPSGAIQNSLMGDYSVGVQNTATTAGPPILRMSNGPIVSQNTLPAAGATTSYVIAVVI